jgi:hypothetical protein
MLRILPEQLLIQIRVPALDRKQEETDEVEEREGWVDPDIVALAADVLDPEGPAGR